MISRIRINWTILRISIEERLIYRADFALGTLLRFMPIVTTILLWQAIFNGVSPTSDSSKETTIDSYSFSDMVSYYLLVMLGRAFSSMPGLASGIAQDVRDGTIKKYLVQPIDLLGFLFWSRVAHKLVYYLVAAGPFAIMFILCHSFLPDWPDTGTLIGAIVALILGFIIGFLFEATVGLISFWFLEVSSLLFIVMMLNYFLSGHMFPLDLLPGPIRSVILFLPFQYLAYFPAKVLLGQLTPGELLQGLVVQVLWVIGLFFLARFLFSRGVRRYSAFGG